MRGLVFTKFLEFVEGAAGPEMVDKMIDACDLPSGGAYTSVGTYDHDEMLKMLTFLNGATGQDVSDMVAAFGRNLFGQLFDSHKDYLNDVESLLDFLEGIESHIHTEVRKLYPDAELPTFETERPAKNHLIMTYHSSRPFADLAFGMINGAVDVFTDKAKVVREEISSAVGFAARFDIRTT